VSIRFQRIGHALSRPSPSRAKARRGLLGLSRDLRDSWLGTLHGHPCTVRLSWGSGPLQGLDSVRRVALYRLPALPPRRFDDLGVFLVVPSSRNVSPAIFPLEVPSSSECSEPRLRPSDPFTVKAPPKRFRDVPGSVGSASREVLAPADTTTSGALLRHELPFGRPCGTRVAKPSPVPSSGFLPLSTVSA